ncbi:MAG: hypothetical protein IPJ98_31365 [Bryobacterales bacterium]|nr:hypothetical protein [Bryobacterales bacterium]
MAPSEQAPEPDIEIHRPVPFWHAPYEFLIHSLVGTLIFGTIAMFAVAIDMAVALHAPKTLSPVIIYGIKFGEYGLFLTDLVLFSVFLYRTAMRKLAEL